MFELTVLNVYIFGNVIRGVTDRTLKNIQVPKGT